MNFSLRTTNGCREQTGLPFLPTPMAKGVLPDDHAQSVAAARNLALQSADVILLLGEEAINTPPHTRTNAAKLCPSSRPWVLIGARLNWILHYGRPPRFSKDVKFIQVSAFSFLCLLTDPTNTATGGHTRRRARQLGSARGGLGRRNQGCPDAVQWDSRRRGVPWLLRPLPPLRGGR